jgi:hypothetical protein
MLTRFVILTVLSPGSVAHADDIAAPLKGTTIKLKKCSRLSNGLGIALLNDFIRGARERAELQRVANFWA